MVLPDNDNDEFRNQLGDFTDALSSIVIEKLAPTNTRPSKKRVKGRKNEIKPVEKPTTDDASNAADNAAAELSEFTEYLAAEIYHNLPSGLRTLSYNAIQDNAGLAMKYALPMDSSVIDSITETLPPSIADSLLSYELISDSDHGPHGALPRFLDSVLTAYITSVTAAPPEYTPGTQATGCEICEREHLPLTYHHLIPRQVAAKAVKRGWHRDWEVNKVAWLCRACHSYVHKIASNEELAREWYSVELLTSREDVQRWAHWVGRVRWKAR